MGPRSIFAQVSWGTQAYSPGHEGPVIQAGRKYTALTPQAFPLPFPGVHSLLLSVWENEAINLPPHL